ncbi:MAG: dioxygenase [Rhodospirillales bacterium]|nr:dioxygenase [Rhodospirillales bacterium]
MNGRFPTLFISHGSPTVLFDDDAAHGFLSGLAAALPKPKEILVISAHWETLKATVSLAAKPETIHDFGGFARALYEVQYPAPGAPALGERAARLLEGAGFDVARDPNRGLDHGAWVPLKLMYPGAAIPVTQLSIQTRLGPLHHLKVGQALAPLRDQGVLIVASGAATHNLQAVFDTRFRLDAPTPDWVAAFAAWLAETLERGDVDDALNYRARAPYAQKNHPSEDHILPLFVALGAAGSASGEAGQAATARRIHASFSFGALAMDVYRFA